MKLKNLLKGAVGVLALSATGASAETMANTMTVVSWGGAYQASQVNAYIDPYVAAHPGLEVVMSESAADAVARLRAMEEAHNVTWDLVDVVASDAMRLCDEGLAITINPDTQLAPAPDGTPASQDFGQYLVSECFIPQIVYSTTFGYRTDMVPAGVAPPTSACDVFDTTKYPGRRALERRPIGNMEWALLCDGVPQDQVYSMLETDAGIARAFAKLDTIKADTVWWTAGAETPQLLADGEVFMGSTYNGRLFAAIVEQHQPIGMAWGYQMLDLDGWIIPQGLAPDHLARVLDFVRFATDTQRLADQAAYISYAPARASSIPLVGNHATMGVAMGPYMPTAPQNMSGAFLFNYTWWADHRDEMDARFQAWLAQ